MIKDKSLEITISEVAGTIRLFSKRYIQSEKQSKWCEKVLSIYDIWQQLRSDLFYLQSIEIESNDDLEWRSLVDGEILDLELKISNLQEQLNILFIDIYPLKYRDVFVEIHALDGGDEANIWVGDLVHIYTRYAESKKLKVEPICQSIDNNWAILEIRGGFVGLFLQFEAGIHQIKRKSPTKMYSNKICVSRAVVTIIPIVNEDEIEIDPRDLELTTVCGGYPRRLNAVGLRHKPTQIYVSCDFHEKQYKNKETAIQIMRSKLYTLNIQNRTDRDRDRTPQIVRIYDYENNIVTNLNSGMEFPLDRILQGELDPLIASNTTDHPII